MRTRPGKTCLWWTKYNNRERKGAANEVIAERDTPTLSIRD